MRKIILALLAVASLTACSGDSSGSGTEVSMTSDRRFDPTELTVGAGDTVTWTNDSSEAHTVTAYEGELPEGTPFFASGGAPTEQAARKDLEDGLLTEGETVEMTFDEPGTYRYFCIPHEDAGMVATVVVE